MERVNRLRMIHMVCDGGVLHPVADQGFRSAASFRSWALQQQWSALKAAFRDGDTVTLPCVWAVIEARHRQFSAVDLLTLPSTAKVPDCDYLYVAVSRLFPTEDAATAHALLRLA